MQVLESIVEGKVVEYAQKCKVIVIKLNLQGRRGWPDRLFLYKGRVLFIEFKAPGEEPRKLQGYIHGILRAEGFDVEVIDSVSGGRKSIDGFVAQNTPDV